VSEGSCLIQVSPREKIFQSLFDYAIL
jgi:hypothetical protein